MKPPDRHRSPRKLQRDASLLLSRPCGKRIKAARSYTLTPRPPRHRRGRPGPRRYLTDLLLGPRAPRVLRNLLARIAEAEQLVRLWQLVHDHLRPARILARGARGRLTVADLNL